MSDPFARDWSFLTAGLEGAVATVRLNRPDARNALNTGLMLELTEFARAIRRRTDIAAVILTGSERYFSAGADLAAQGERRRPTLLETREAVMAGPDMCEAWEQVEAVTIAAIEGYCIGGGCALVAACDFRVMGEGAYLRLPEIPLGINMSWRSIPRIHALVVRRGPSSSSCSARRWTPPTACPGASAKRSRRPAGPWRRRGSGPARSPPCRPCPFA